MKAASAHKMILNMLSTSVMIRQGKVYENLMVDVKVSNHKLKERAITIIQHVTNASYEQAVKALEAADLEVKTAIVMLQTKTDKRQPKTCSTKQMVTSTKPSYVINLKGGNSCQQADSPYYTQ